jgi:hypothetical protein
MSSQVRILPSALSNKKHGRMQRFVILISKTIKATSAQERVWVHRGVSANTNHGAGAGGYHPNRGEAIPMDPLGMIETTSRGEGILLLTGSKTPGIIETILNSGNITIFTTGGLFPKAMVRGTTLKLGNTSERKHSLRC